MQHKKTAYTNLKAQLLFFTIQFIVVTIGYYIIVSLLEPTNAYTGSLLKRSVLIGAFSPIVAYIFGKYFYKAPKN